MYLKAELPWNVAIPAEDMDAKGLMLQRSIIIRLLEEFASKKATKDLGYYIAVTELKKIEEGSIQQKTGEVVFPIVFSGITFKIFRGEVLQGLVYKVLKDGVFLRCGPMERIYLSCLKMRDYKYMAGENPIFLNDKMSKIELGVTVRFMVIDTKWMEVEREFQALASLEGHYLGPISEDQS